MPQGVAWAGHRPAGPRDARERLLAATARCIQRYGLDKTGVSDVAAEAGVTRRTVYRYFADRDTLVSAALVQGVGEFAERARALIAGHGDPAEMVVEGVIFALRELPRDPLLGRIVVSGEAMLTEASFPDAFAVLAHTIEPLTRAAGWSERDLDECGELIIRVALSLMAAPREGRSEDSLRGFLRRRLLPALGLGSDRQA